MGRRGKLPPSHEASAYCLNFGVTSRQAKEDESNKEETSTPFPRKFLVADQEHDGLRSSFCSTNSRSDPSVADAAGTSIASD